MSGGGTADRAGSRASVGGSAGAVGAGFQDAVFAWVAAAVVAERTIPGGRLLGDAPVQVGAQTGAFMDDVEARTESGDRAFIQAKAGLGLGSKENSALAMALGQAVRQYLDGTVKVRDGGMRRVDPKRDCLVICTDSKAPSTVRRDLSVAIERTGSLPPGSPLGDGLTQAQGRALAVALRHIRRHWAATGRADPAAEVVRAFLRSLHLVTVDAADGGPDRATAVAAVATVLADPARAGEAWSVLVDEGHVAAEKRTWVDRVSLGVSLARAGIELLPAVRYRDQVAALRDLSAVNMRALKSEAVLRTPDGPIHLARDVTRALLTHAGRGNLLVVGDAGAGKSAVVQEFAEARMEHQEVLMLRATDVAGPNRAQIGAPLQAVLHSWTGLAGLIVIDGFDALRDATDRTELTRLLSALEGTRWQVVASVRTFDARHGARLPDFFPGGPLEPRTPGVPEFRGLRHVRVEDFEESELACLDWPPLADLLESAQPELKSLLCNPFNLSIAAQVLAGAQQPLATELDGVRTRVDLLSAYWTQRVREGAPTARDAVLRRLTRAMAERRALRVPEVEPVVLTGDGDAVQDLLSAHVLRYEGSGRQGVRVLSFAHNILFDWACAIYVLLGDGDPTSLCRTLDGDPALALTVRPSLDLLVDLLWQDEPASEFWPTCLAVAASPHVLASLAFAARLPCLVRSSDDLAPLYPTGAEQLPAQGMLPRQSFTGRVVGALRSETVVPDPLGAIEPLAVLALRLASNAPSASSDAELAANLLAAIRHRASGVQWPGWAARPSSDVEGDALALLLDACRDDPVRMERLAGFAARGLGELLGSSVELRRATQRLLADPDALAQWGGTILTELARALVAAARVDRELARRMATAVLTFEETRDEQVTFGSSAVLPMNESRRQQAEHGAHLIADSFSELCDADLVIAAHAFCDLARDVYPTGSETSWPLRIAHHLGGLSYGPRLDRVAYGSGSKAASELAVALVVAEAGLRREALAVLIEWLSSSGAWVDLMSPEPSQEIPLARALLPAMSSGGLLGHPDTQRAAANLMGVLARVAPEMSSEIESAVLAAIDLIAANGGSLERSDNLLGCLAQKIADPALRARRDAYVPADAPRPASRREWAAIISEGGAEDPIDGWDEEPNPELVAAVQVLSTEWTAVAGEHGGRRTTPRLRAAFATAATAPGATERLPARVELLFAQVAAALATDGEVLPGTSVGELVSARLLSAAKSPEAGELLR